MNKAYLVDVSIINPIEEHKNIRVFDISKLEISNHMNKHGKMTLTGLINKDEKATLNKIRKDYNYMFIKATTILGQVEALSYPALEMQRRQDKKKSSTLFYGFISTLDMNTYINDNSKMHLDITCYSLSKLFDMVEDCAAYTNTAYSLSEIARDLPHCITNISYNFWGTDLSLVQERESIINADQFTLPMDRMNICYKETPWEFLKRMASKYGASLFNNIDKETVLSTFCLSADVMYNFIRDFPQQVNILDSSVSLLRSYGTYVNPEMYVSGSTFEPVFKEVFVKADIILQAGQLVRLDHGLIGEHKFLEDITFFVSGIDITLSPNGATLESFIHCKEKSGLYIAPYYNPKIKGVTLFGSVLEQREEGVVLTFGERFKQRDGAPYYPMKQGVSFQSYKDAKFKMYKKLYGWAGYLSCSYTDSDELYKKGRRDVPRLMFKDDPKRYTHLAKSLTYNSFKTEYSKYLDFKGEALSVDSKTIPFHTVSYGNSNSGKVQGAIYMPVVADIVKVFFPSDDEDKAISLSVPHMFEPSVSEETLSIKKSSIDLPDPRNNINDPSTPSSSVNSDASTLANNLSTYSQNAKDSGDDQTFPSISYYGDPQNPHLKVYNDYKQDYIQHKEATIIDRKGLLSGLKKSTMKITNINNLDNDDECEGASIHLGGEKGDFLVRASRAIQIRANKKLTITSKEVHIVAGDNLNLSQTSSSKDLLLNDQDLTYTSTSSDFKNT